MEISEFKTYPSFEEGYNVRIEQTDDLNEWEIAECFKKQYPKKKVLISFSRIVKMECGLIFLGIKLGKAQTRAKASEVKK